MNPRTTATIEELECANWFSAVGQFDLEHVKILSTWDEAIDVCVRTAWRDITFEAKNLLTERIFKAGRERFNDWNNILKAIEPNVKDLVRRKIGKVAHDYDLPELFTKCVEWDIRMLLMESEYSDVCQPGFFSALAFFYVKGHFPCGWEGQHPQGRLIVY